jgi:hypothetical protein
LLQTVDVKTAGAADVLVATLGLTNFSEPAIIIPQAVATTPPSGAEVPVGQRPLLDNASLAAVVPITPQPMATTQSSGTEAPVGLGGSFVSLAAGARPAAVASSNEPVAQPQASRPSTESGAAPTINWDNRIDVAGNLAPSPAAGSPAWLDDFVNHLGRSEAQRNPNAGIRVRPAPVAAGHV